MNDHRSSLAKNAARCCPLLALADLQVPLIGVDCSHSHTGMDSDAVKYYGVDAERGENR
jgi:hypothetical protein